MAANLLVCCYVVITSMLLSSFLIGRALAFHIEIRPEVFDKVKNDFVEISCLQMDKATTIKEILALEIVKDGKPVVVLRKNSQLTFTGGMDKRNRAVGHIDDDVVQGYLNLTLVNPTSDVSGLYTCVMDYLDEVNIIKVEKDSKTLTEQEVSLQSVEESLTFLKQKIQLNEKSCADKIDRLEKLLTYSTSFSVTNNDDIKTVNRQTLILPDVISKQGVGYNVTTGVFTAPVQGLYAFHLVVRAFYKGKDWFRLDLMANSNTLAKLTTDVDDHYSQSSVSSVVDLNAGDRVYTVMRDDGFLLDGDKHTIFTGYLIKAW